MWRRLSFVVVVGLCGCSDPASGPPRGGLGTLAFVSIDDGALTLLDLESEESITVVEGGLPIAAVTLDAAARNVAFAQDTATGTAVFAVRVGDDAPREIFPPAGETTPAFAWLRDGWFWYPFVAGGAPRSAIVPPDQTDARLVGNRDSVPIVQSPTGTVIAYPDCVALDGAFCRSELVLEQPDGSGRVVMATVQGTPTPLFTHAGSDVIYADDVDGERHGFVHPVAGGAPLDIGMVPNWSLLSPRSGGSVISPDDAWLLAQGGGQLRAFALDGSGSRVIADEYAIRAMFSGAGDVVYETRRNTDEPPDDTPNYVYSAHVVAAGGSTWALKEDDTCRLSALSPSGQYVTFQCAGAQNVHDIDGSLVAETDGYHLLGFDRDEAGVVVAEHGGGVIRYVPLDGSPAREVARYRESGGLSVGADYAP